VRVDVEASPPRPACAPASADRSVVMVALESLAACAVRYARIFASKLVCRTTGMLPRYAERALVHRESAMI
jgi:hypothetical protein